VMPNPLGKSLEVATELYYVNVAILDERAFAMPIRVGDPAKWQVVQPSADWKSMEWSAGKDAFKVATDLYYVNVQILNANGRP